MAVGAVVCSDYAIRPQASLQLGKKQAAVAKLGKGDGLKIHWG
jgi:hypothetical protein